MDPKKQAVISGSLLNNSSISMGPTTSTHGSDLA